MPDPREVEALLEAGPRHDETVPEDQNPECARCVDRRDRYEHAAAGNGTVAEIRQAVDALEAVKASGVPLGRKVKLGDRWACPRCTNAGDDDEPVSLLEVAPNRAARRRIKARLRR